MSELQREQEAYRSAAFADPFYPPKETLFYLKAFRLSLSKPLKIRRFPFDKPVLSQGEGLGAHGVNQSLLPLLRQGLA